MIIRPIQHQDLQALLAIARETGPGFTSLMDDVAFLREKIDHSIDSFERVVVEPENEHYLFVLVDEGSGEIMGTTGIEACAGHERPLLHFRRTPLPGSRHEQLTRCNHYTGCTEVCSLYLRPSHRRPNAGKLLSKVRFLFMAQHPDRFASTVIAEMRGVSDERGQSPFWNWLKVHGGNLDFATVTRLAGTARPEVLDALLPETPMSTATMPLEARRVIGQVHPQTRPALKMLSDEGFRHTGFVDLFDAGPTVEAPLHRITSVQRSGLCQVQVVDDRVTVITRNQPDNHNRAILLTNTGTTDFRASVTTSATWLPHRQTLVVPRSLASELMLESGSMARQIPLHKATDSVAPQTAPFTTEVQYAH